MAEHLHPQYVEGCYRCEIGRDEAAPACPECDDTGLRRRGVEVLPCHCTEVEE